MSYRELINKIKNLFKKKKKYGMPISYTIEKAGLRRPEDVINNVGVYLQTTEGVRELTKEEHLDFINRSNGI